MKNANHSPVKLIAIGNRLEDPEHRCIVPVVQAYDFKDPAFSLESGVLAANDEGGEANARRLAMCWNNHDALLNRVEMLETVMEGLISALEKSDEAAAEKGRIENAMAILINDPIMLP